MKPVRCAACFIVTIGSFLLRYASVQNVMIQALALQAECCLKIALGRKCRHLALNFRKCDQLLCGDLYVGHNVGVAALLIATVDCGRCITVRAAIGYRRIGIQCAGVHDCVDLVERTAACGVRRAIHVVPRDARRIAWVPRQVY